MCSELPNEFIDRENVSIPFNKPLADPDFNKPKEIDILLGIELFFQLLSIGQEPVTGSKTMWQKTKLGWILAGKINIATKARK
jgi:hypothetical protein